MDKLTITSILAPFTGPQCTYKPQIETQKGFVSGHGATWLRSTGDRLPCSPTHPAAALVPLVHARLGLAPPGVYQPWNEVRWTLGLVQNACLGLHRMLTSRLEYSNDATLISSDPTDSGQKTSWFGRKAMTKNIIR